ncbi:MAG: hypothetical protein ACLUZ6_14860 [Lachnospira eligens]
MAAMYAIIAGISGAVVLLSAKRRSITDNMNQ